MLIELPDLANKIGGCSVKLKFCIKTEYIFSVFSLQYLGHIYIPQLFAVYLKFEFNWEALLIGDILSKSATVGRRQSSSKNMVADELSGDAQRKILSRKPLRRSLGLGSVTATLFSLQF